MTDADADNNHQSFLSSRGVREKTEKTPLITGPGPRVVSFSPRIRDRRAGKAENYLGFDSRLADPKSGRKRRGKKRGKTEGQNNNFLFFSVSFVFLNFYRGDLRGEPGEFRSVPCCLLGLRFGLADRINSSHPHPPQNCCQHVDILLTHILSFTVFLCRNIILSSAIFALENSTPPSRRRKTFPFHLSHPCSPRE